MKEGWTYKKLGEVCESLNGLWKGKKPPYMNVGVIRNANFTKDFTLNFDNIEYLDVEEKQYSKRKLRAGDIIVEKSGGSDKQPVGRAVLFDKSEGEYSFSNFTSVLRIKDQNEIYSAFLYKYLLYVYLGGATKKMQKATTGIHNLEFQQYLNIDVPCIEMGVQQRIVERLDSAFENIDELKANAEKQLAEARILFQKSLAKAMEPKEGWEEKALGDVCTLSQGLAINSHTKHLLIQNGSLPLLRIKDMKEGTREIFVDEANCPQGCIASEEDIIYTRTGTLGLVFTGMHGVLHNNCFKIKHDINKLNKSFLIYFLRNDSFVKTIIGLASRAAQPDITHKLFKAQEIHFPPLAEQQRIVERLDSLSENVRKYEEIQRQILSECDALKQALLRKVFE